MPRGATKILFGQAVNELLHINNVSGLVIDFRTNFGGVVDYANDGLKQLFNFDPTNNFSRALRIAGSDHNAFTFSPPEAYLNFTPGHSIFDRPIAVLTGPQGGSAGDYNAFRLRFHPMVRFFGKRTNGAYTNSSVVNEGIWYNLYSYRIDNGSVYSKYNNEGFMTHKSFPVDEEIWLTQAGVAKGEDDVVKRALEWVTTLTHTHGTVVDRPFFRPGLDSVFLKTTLSNPLNHASAISAIVTDASGSTRDSILLYNDGLHGDGSAGDSIWGCRFLAPSDENMFTVSIRTDDLANSAYRRLPNVQRFTTAGPLVLDSLEEGKIFGAYKVKPHIRNGGKNVIIGGAMVNLRCSDPWVTNILTFSSSLLPDLAPGASLPMGGLFIVSYDTATFPGYFNFKVEVNVGGYAYWTDSTKLVVTGVGENRNALPTVFNLEQNYPNPFNPSTVISYQLPVNSNVSLKIYDLLGREIATLVNEEQSAGWKEVKWNATGVASGIYFYKLTAGSFVETKKMLMLK